MIGLSGLITPSLDEMVHVAKEMKRTGLHRPAPDRRGHDERRPHRRQDRARVPARGRPRARRLARRQRRQLAPLPGEQARLPGRGAGKAGRSSARSSRRAGRESPLLSLAGRPRAPPDVRLGHGRHPAAGFPRARGRSPIGARWTRSSPSSTGAPSSAPGSCTAAIPDILTDPVVGDRGDQASRRRPGAPRPDRRGEALHREGRHRLLALQRRRRRHRGLRRRGPQPASRPRSTCCASSWRSPRTSSTTAWPTTSPRRTAAASTTSAASPSRPATASRSSPPSSGRRTDDYSRHHGPGAGRPPGRGHGRDVPQARARRLRLRPDREPQPRGPDPGKIPRHPPGAGLSRLPRPHREADPLPPARRRGRHRHHA